MKIARVFPRRTLATPTDELAFINCPPMMGMPDFDEVHISVAFTYDIPIAQWLYKQWETIGVPVKIGGPAFDEPGGEFIPGRYLKEGYIITSRGCPNRCWFCAVPKREGYRLRELPITHGWNVLDDNILACSESHIRSVVKMLKKQPERPVFTGGLEAKLLKPWHVELLREVKTKRMYFAYDTPDDYEPLVEAGKLLRNGGFNVRGHVASAYVLIGYPHDTFQKAEKRLMQTIEAGFQPYAMLWKDKDGTVDEEWKPFQREWCRPMIAGKKFTDYWTKIEKCCVK